MSLPGEGEGEEPAEGSCWSVCVCVGGGAVAGQIMVYFLGGAPSLRGETPSSVNLVMSVHQSVCALTLNPKAATRSRVPLLALPFFRGLSRT